MPEHVRRRLKSSPYVETNGNGSKPGWFDRRVTLSGMIQIVLLLVAILKFSGDIDKRTAILEITVKGHEEILHSNAMAIQTLTASSQRMDVLLEQFQLRYGGSNHP